MGKGLRNILTITDYFGGKNTWRILLLLLLALFALLRFHRLDIYPLQINQDELSNVYDGYCIAKTGADRWGDKYPLILHGFGNYDSRPAMYAWLAAACMKTGGYSIFTGRMPSAILGTISLLLIFLVADKFGGKRFAFLSLLLAGLSPWHLLFSKLAHEGAMLPGFFFILSLYLFILCKEKRYPLSYLITMGIVMGLGTSTYQSGRLVFFFFSALVLFDILRSSEIKKMKTLGVFASAVLLGTLPQIVVLAKHPDLFFARAGETVIPPAFTYEYVNFILKNILAGISPDFLFLSAGSYNNLSVARLLLVEVFFFYFGLFFLKSVLKKNSDFKTGYLYFLLFVLVLPSIITNNCPHALRNSAMMMLLPMISAAGILWILEKIKILAWRRIAAVFTVTAIMANGFAYIYIYKHNYYFRDYGHQHLLYESCIKLNKYKSSYEKILIEHAFVEPYLYVAAYCNVTPEEFRSAQIEFNQPNRENVKRLNNYYFINPDQLKDSLFVMPEKALLMCRNKRPDMQLVDSMANEEGTVFYYKK